MRKVASGSDTEVLIVGGGAVGLFLGCRLVQLGVPCRVLERAPSPRPHSRSIGVHPPSLERLATLGLAEAFLREGIKVGRGHAFAGSAAAMTRLGTLEFSLCPPPYPFVLSLPQGRTEALLAAHLERAAPGTLVRGAEVTAVVQNADGVSVQVTHEGRSKGLRAPFLVAADGKGSFIRQALAIPFKGRRYPDTYLMGDTADTTGLGSDAALYFTPEGLVESFPLPGGLRRWVVKTPTYTAQPTPEGLEQLVWQRLGVRAPTETNTMLSAFGVQRFLAPAFTKGRVVLVGDAAHVLSPIGGQGMNLGWLNAWALADTLGAVLGDTETTATLNLYARARRRAARVAIRRAEFNTVMGRANALDGLRNTLAWSILHTPVKRRAANIFTMRGI